MENNVWARSYPLERRICIISRLIFIVRPREAVIAANIYIISPIFLLQKCHDAEVFTFIENGNLHAQKTGRTGGAFKIYSKSSWFLYTVCLRLRHLALKKEEGGCICY